MSVAVFLDFIKNTMQFHREGIIGEDLRVAISFTVGLIQEVVVVVLDIVAFIICSCFTRVLLLSALPVAILTGVIGIIGRWHGDGAVSSDINAHLIMFPYAHYTGGMTSPVNVEERANATAFSAVRRPR